MANFWNLEKEREPPHKRIMQGYCPISNVHNILGVRRLDLFARYKKNYVHQLPNATVWAKFGDAGMLNLVLQCAAKSILNLVYMY